LYNYKNAPGSQHASLFKDVIEHIHHGESTVVQVDVTTIDRFMEEHAIQKIDVLKIDTEGNDLNVLHGAKHAIEQQQIDIIHFEFNEMNVVSRVFFKDFCDILPNYTFYRMLPDGIISLGEYYPLVFEIFAFQNIVAIRKGVSIT
jgi:dynactin complex subunit